MGVAVGVAVAVAVAGRCGGRGRVGRSLSSSRCPSRRRSSCHGLVGVASRWQTRFESVSRARGSVDGVLSELPSGDGRSVCRRRRRGRQVGVAVGVGVAGSWVFLIRIRWELSARPALLQFRGQFVFTRSNCSQISRRDQGGLGRLDRISEHLLPIRSEYAQLESALMS